MEIIPAFVLNEIVKAIVGNAISTRLNQNKIELKVILPSPIGVIISGRGVTSTEISLSTLQSF
jgi:hypothetical protein